ncbi:hypothetical protein [Aquimarina agarilytica]|nr:hypothetical protein [Aquimarina agarilytica]
MDNFLTNDFLIKWVHRQLTLEEEALFLKSENYKNLVVSSTKSY